MRKTGPGYDLRPMLHTAISGFAQQMQAGKFRRPDIGSDPRYPGEPTLGLNAWRMLCATAIFNDLRPLETKHQLDAKAITSFFRRSANLRIAQETLKYIFCDHHCVNICLHEPMYPFARRGGKDLTSTFVEVHHHTGPTAVHSDAGVAQVGRQDGSTKPGIAVAEHK